MEIKDIVAGKEYLILPSRQTVKLGSKKERNIIVVYTSDDEYQGMFTEMNEIQCREWLREL